MERFHLDQEKHDSGHFTGKCIKIGLAVAYLRGHMGFEYLRLVNWGVVTIMVSLIYAIVWLITHAT